MKSEKGITLTSLAIYIMVVIIVVGILATITVSLRSNIKDINKEGTSDIEIDKFNMYFLQDVKKQGNQIATISDSEIVFTLGNKYNFKDDNAIYLNDNIKIAEDIEKCSFANKLENGKQIIYVTIKTQNGNERTIEYTLNDDTNNLAYNEETNYIHNTYYNTPKNSDGTLTANATYTSDGYTAIVPKGFKIIEGTEGKQSIAEGLVIQDGEGNEFVWIPVVPKEGQDFSEVFYRSDWVQDESTGGKRGSNLTNDTTYTEPYKNGYPEEVTEYNAMWESVKKNKGFYIGRYEAGSETSRTETSGDTTIVVKRNMYPYHFVSWGSAMNNIDDICGDSGHGAVYLSKHFYDEKDVGVVPTLCYGVQWDAMLDFIKSKDRDVINSTSWGNYKDNNWTITNQNAKYSIDNGTTWKNISDEPNKQKNKGNTTDEILLTTGASDNFSAKNIYDVAGNCFEWNMDPFDANTRTGCGRLVQCKWL